MLQTRFEPNTCRSLQLKPRDCRSGLNEIQRCYVFIKYHQVRVILTTWNPWSPFTCSRTARARPWRIFSSPHDVRWPSWFSDHLDSVMCATCNSGSPAAVEALLAARARTDNRTAHGHLVVNDSRCDRPQTSTTPHAPQSRSLASVVGGIG